MKKNKIILAAVLFLLVLLLFWKETDFFHELTDSVTEKWTDSFAPIEKEKETEKTEQLPKDASTDTPEEQIRLLKNVWIFSSEDSQMSVYAGEKRQIFQLSGTLAEPIRECIADLTLINGKVTGITLKKETIVSRVLRADEKVIALGDYGNIPVAKEFRCYQMYDGFSEEPTEKLLVGLKNCEFVMENGEICAALLREKPRLSEIRVLLSTSGYEGYYHKEVTITSTADFSVTTGDKIKKYKAGDSVVLSAKDFKENDARRLFLQETEGGRFLIEGLKRSGGVPKYRGSLEVEARTEGLLVINELPLEEYLYAVVPSEMPASFHEEARKAQTICARSYAYAELFSNRYAAYGAHVDDSVSCQVYQNIPESEAAILAVKKTHGQILLYGGKTAQCYYFSTSCGHTASVTDVFHNASEKQYLKGSLFPKKTGESAAERLTLLLAGNPTGKEMEHFLMNTELLTMDSESPWYRWSTFLPLRLLEKNLTATLKDRYQVVKNQILTYNKESGTFESKPIGELGSLRSLQILLRGTGGVAMDLYVIGSKNTFLIKKEYNIRSVLSPKGALIERRNAESVTGGALLPSAFITMQRGTYKEEEGYLISGGGYGHGVGMSQYGANGMAEEGASCEEILSAYYPGTEIAVMEESERND